MLWHYTTFKSAARICKDGQSNVARLNLKLTVRAAAWFSSNQSWETTATRMIGSRRMELREMLQRGGGLVRFGVNKLAAPVNWHTFKSSSGITSDTASELMLTGLQLGAVPTEWFCSFTPVDRDKWIKIEEIADDAFCWAKSTRLR